jgi:Zn-dependent protease
MVVINNEKRDLIIAGLMISLAFAVLLSGGYKALFDFNLDLLMVFFVAFLTAGLGFMLHEIAHKIVAQGYGLFAEFRAYYNGLWLALLFSMFGFIIAAPGAVYIRGHNITKEKNGKISLAGPATNIVLASIFLISLLIFGREGLLGIIFEYGLSINSLLAVFNMIPILPFDGAKIKDWNVGIYFITAIFAGALFLSSWFI